MKTVAVSATKRCCPRAAWRSSSPVVSVVPLAPRATVSPAFSSRNRECGSGGLARGHARHVDVEPGRADAAKERANEVANDVGDPICLDAEEEVHDVGTDGARGVDGGAGG